MPRTLPEAGEAVRSVDPAEDLRWRRLLSSLFVAAVGVVPVRLHVHGDHAQRRRHCAGRDARDEAERELERGGQRLRRRADVLAHERGHGARAPAQRQRAEERVRVEVQEAARAREHPAGGQTELMYLLRTVPAVSLASPS
jgi:hypothetical protein